ncbi:hypothetical protein Q7C36_006410 [Tachysurus vachellii]|uniref:Complex 1 LYR protein domain-containing protein n=1 Tax=Tachysurus vachellii TaxID=175792 RepID=A0AA88T5C7_TACVA|nr:hypothetical protein Q7C36_006410 [Tachysurus vachellii]
MAAPSRTQVLALYRMLLRESNKFTSYNYRTERDTKDRERHNRKIKTRKTERQKKTKTRKTAAIGKMYEVQRTVVESEPKKFN